MRDEDLKDKEVYNSEICIFCTHREDCTLDKFIVINIDGKKSMRCYKYDYEDKI